MADPVGIIGLIGVATQIIQISVQFGLDWKDAPEDVRGFIAELKTLKSTLSELHANILVNEDIRNAFHGRHSIILSQLDPTSQSDTTLMLSACRPALDKLLLDLAGRAQGRRIGWERLKGAFLAIKTREAVQNLQRRSQMLNSMLTMDAIALGSHIHKEVTEARKRQKTMHETQMNQSLMIRDVVENLDKQQADQQASLERRTVLDWLTRVDYTIRQSDILSRHEPGTGQYLLNSEEYQTWLQGSQMTLFGPGIPGAGKTIITAIMIDDLSKKFGSDSSVGIAYLYCNYQREDEQKIDDLLVNILKQLAQTRGSLPIQVKSLYEKHKCKGTQPSVEDLVENLQSTVALFSRVFIIVDALDECTTSSNCREIFLTRMFELQMQCNVSLFATSRHIPEITQRFKEAPSLEIYARSEDVMKFLKGNGSKLPRCAARDPGLQNEIRTGIMMSVNGMFLLAQLFLDSLRGKKSPKTVRTALKSFPKGHDAYDQAYKDAMERIMRQEPEEVELAMQVLCWIIYARPSLSTSELEHAIATEPGQRRFDKENLCPIDDMISVCAGLITVDRRSHVVRLVHLTTRQYFAKTQKAWFPDAEKQITTRCMTYLSFDNFAEGYCYLEKEFAERTLLFPLYEYASSRWGYHAQHVLSFNENLLDFLKCEAKAGACSQALHSRLDTWSGLGDRSKRMTGLHLSVFFNLEIICQMLLETNEIDARDGNERTPLLYAVERKNKKLARMLLENGADINTVDNKGRTPLWTAVFSKDAKLVQLLLQHDKVDPNIKDHERGSTPLSLAVSRNDKTITELLLNVEKVDVDAKDAISNRTPLSIAAGNHNLTILELLILTERVDIDAEDGSGRNSLSWAAGNPTGRDDISRSRCKAVISALLAAGVNLESKDNKGRTAIMFAASGDSHIFFWLILEMGADPWAMDESGRTAISTVLRRGNGIDVKSFVDEYDEKFALMPTSNSNPRPVRHMLFATLELPRKTRLMVKIIQGFLSKAIREGNLTLVEFILASNQVDPSWKDERSRSPLWHAHVGGQKEIARLLRSYGAVL